MKKLFCLLLLTTAMRQAVVQAQCPPGAAAYQSVYPQCTSGCGVLLLGWPEGVLVNIYGGTPLSIITNVTVSGTLGGGGTGDAFTCVPCNTPLVYAASNPGATNGCVISTLGTVAVKISNFKASLSANNAAVLHWSAFSETGTVTYAVQRSSDGRNFTDVGKLNGQQLPINNYSFSDPTALNGQFYYRIKATELNGNIIFSETAMLKLSNAAGVSIYPNPAANDFTVAVPEKNLPATLQIFNAQGVLVHTALFNQAAYTITKFLPRDIYLVKITGSNRLTVTQKLIKK